MVLVKKIILLSFDKMIGIIKVFTCNNTADLDIHTIVTAVCAHT